MQFHGRTALITGASSGIGAAFARALASRGADVVLVSRSEDKLRNLAAQLAADHGVRAEYIVADLSRESSGLAVAEEARRRVGAVDILINNAGFATYGRFDRSEGAREHEQIMLNVAAVVDLTHACLPDMVARKSGMIVNVASTAAMQPVPYMAVYAASKAFVLSFSEALWAEERRHGVRVLALCPGATDTPFFDVVAAPEASLGKRESPEIVVERAFAALARRRSTLISGFANFLLAQLARLLPRAHAALVSERVMRPRQPLLGGAR
jgi:short-subunit dehydrogenase